MGAGGAQFDFQKSSHLQPLAATCQWLQVAASGCKWLLGQVAASGCKWLQVAASGCKWLQVAAWASVSRQTTGWLQEENSTTIEILLGRRQWTKMEEHGNWEQKGAAGCRGQPAKRPRKTSQLTHRCTRATQMPQHAQNFPLAVRKGRKNKRAKHHQLNRVESA